MRGRWIIGLVIVFTVMVLLVLVKFYDGEDIDRYRYLDREVVLVETDIYPVYIDFAFLRRDIIEIERAIGRWNRVLNGYRRLEVVDTNYMDNMEVAKRAVDGEAYLILRLESDSDLLNERAGEMTLAFTNKIGGTIMYIVSDSISDLKLEGVTMYGVVLHEIGHWMGARHVEMGLMEAKYNIGSYLCVDEGTVRQVGNWFRGYDWRKMNYCIIEKE